MALSPSTIRVRKQQQQQLLLLLLLPGLLVAVTCSAFLIGTSHAKLMATPLPLPVRNDTDSDEPPCLKCDDGAQCVSEYSQCDGNKDCADGADESLELCGSSFNCSATGRVACPAVQSLLPLPVQCIGTWQMCDGTGTCPGDMDEASNTCSKFDCSIDGRVSCPSGGAGCVSSYLLCDGKKHCADGSDEWPDFCRRLNCSETYRVSCPGGVQCTNSWSFCDGNFDCADGSDESPTFCSTFNCSSVEKVPCPTVPWVRAKPQCIYPSDLCEGNTQCPGGADEEEMFCASHECSPGYVKCKEKGHTICKGGSYCDGEVTCVEDGSDEGPFFCKGFSCPEGMVKCKDGLQCIYESQQCNNVPECKDGSDESPTLCDESFNCSATYRVPCPSGRYCMENYCNVCNNSTAPASCPDKSDQLESNCHLRNESQCFWMYEDCFSNNSGGKVCAKGGSGGSGGEKPQPLGSVGGSGGGAVGGASGGAAGGSSGGVVSNRGEAEAGREVGGSEKPHPVSVKKPKKSNKGKFVKGKKGKKGTKAKKGRKGKRDLGKKKAQK